MDIKKIVAGTAAAGVLGLGGLAVGAGLAQADPHGPGHGPWPTVPGNSDNNDDQGQDGQWGNWGDDRDDAGNPVTGPGVNVGAPGNPIPPGLGFRPPGHGGPMPQDRIAYPSIPQWIVDRVAPPDWALPQPAVPDWAMGLPVVWNPELNVWGVWDVQTGTFIRL